MSRGDGLARLRQALEEYGCTIRGTNAQCPAHDDRSPSLSVTQGRDSAVLKCHGGCETDAVLEALGMRAAELFDEPRSASGYQVTATYPYTDEQGTVLYYAERRIPKDFRQYRMVDGRKVWNLGGARLVLYQLPQVLEAVSSGQPVYIVEGEKDVHAVEAAGSVATCNPMGAGKWRPGYGDTLKGCAVVVIIADRDKPGYAHAAAVKADLDGKASMVIVARAAEGKDVSEHLAAGHTLAELVPIATETTESTEWVTGGDFVDSVVSVAWERPSPLGTLATLPEFPADAFPGWVKAEVEAVAEFTQTPADLGGTVAIGVLAAAAGGRVVVEVRGSWREPLNLFTVAAMPPGSRKSSVFDTMTGPLLDTERVLVDKIEPDIIEAATQRKVAQKDADRLAAAASTAKGDKAKAMAEAIAAAQFAESITVPVSPRLVADDITPEAAASLLAEQGGRLAVLSAEGGIFATLAGRYSGGVPSIEVFLKGHSGDMLRVDRKGRPPEHVGHPALTLALCVQPEVLRAIADMPGFRGRGLLARILYSLPPDIVGHRKIGAPPVPQDVQETYAANVSTLVLTLAEWTDPAVLVLTPEAAEVVLAAEEAIEPRLDADTGDLASIRDWASKQIGATVRIAGLLHLAAHLTDGWGKPIAPGTMRDALRITSYYTAHALAAFDHMGVDPVLSDARAVYRWIERTRPAKFTRREVHMGVSRARFPKVGDLDAPLDLLEQHGYIRRQPEPERTGPGRRPSPSYEVHPDLAAETAVSAQ